MTRDDRSPEGAATDEAGAAQHGPAEPSHEVALRVVRGDASAEEVAALVAVLASLGGAAPAPPRRTPEWSAHHRRLRSTFPHGPGGWRSSGLPR